jgi:uncharacterized protein (DUF983 family)
MMAEWIFDDADEYGYSYKCSNCRRVIMFRKNSDLTDECPNCGADMRGKKNDNWS